MNKEIIKSVEDAAQAIENLNRTFDQHSETLKKSGDLDGLAKWKTACFAMLDSGKIYITWAQYYAGVSDPDESSEMETDFLDEGAVWDGR